MQVRRCPIDDPDRQPAQTIVTTFNNMGMNTAQLSAEFSVESASPLAAQRLDQRIISV